MAPPTTKIKVPTFLPARPDVFFGALETQFRLHKVDDQFERYASLVLGVSNVALDEKSSDMISKPPDVDPYDTLKQAVLECISPSSLNEARAMMLKERLGVSKPSDFLARLHRIGAREGTDTQVAQEDIRDAWLRGLPSEWHNTLLTYNSLKDAAEVADNLKLWRENPLHTALYNKATGADGASTSFPVAAAAAPLQVSAATLDNSTGARLTRLEEAMLDIRNMLRSNNRNNSGYDNYNNRGNSDNSGQRRGRSRTPARVNNGICSYHEKYGQDAYRCLEGCRHFNAHMARRGSQQNESGNFQGRAQ